MFIDFFELVILTVRKVFLTARVAPISDSVMGGMLASKYAIMQAHRIYVLDDCLFAIS